MLKFLEFQSCKITKTTAGLFGGCTLARTLSDPTLKIFSMCYFEFVEGEDKAILGFMPNLFCPSILTLNL